MVGSSSENRIPANCAMALTCEWCDCSSICFVTGQSTSRAQNSGGSDSGSSLQQLAAADDHAHELADETVPTFPKVKIQ